MVEHLYIYVRNLLEKRKDHQYRGLTVTSIFRYLQFTLQIRNLTGPCTTSFQPS